MLTDMAQKPIPNRREEGLELMTDSHDKNKDEHKKRRLYGKGKKFKRCIHSARQTTGD